jgi:hypothetical protein
MKQINLSDSKIVGAHINVKNGTIKNVIVEGKVYDDVGNVVSTENDTLPWGSMSVQAKQTVNKLMKVLSNEYSKHKVNEDIETWEDSQ